MSATIKYRFKQNHSLEKRQAESLAIKKKYPDRLPVICEVAPNQTINLDKNKYLVPIDLTVGQFLYVIRKRLKLTPEQAIFVFVNNTLPPTSSLMSHLYNENRDEDGFLYTVVSAESTFGN